MTKRPFEDRVALVTGGGSGIGRAAAERLAAQGAAVMIANRGEDTGREAVAAIEAAGGTARYTPVDVADEASVLAMFGALDEAFGERLHVLVNSAGTVATTTTPDTALEDLGARLRRQRARRRSCAASTRWRAWGRRTRRSSTSPRWRG